MVRGRHLPAWCAVRVAYTLEQCWHRVPGGTAVAALEVAAAPGARDARRGRRALPPAPAGAAVDAARSACGRCPLPRAALYDAWLRLRPPPVQLATGRVDVDPRHHHRRAAPHGPARRDDPRPRLPARARATSPRRGAAGLPPRPRARPPATPTSCCARRWPRWPTPRPPASPSTGCATCPLGVQPWARPTPAAAPPLRPRSALPPLRRHPRAPQEPGPPGGGGRPAADRPRAGGGRARRLGRRRAAGRATASGCSASSPTPSATPSTPAPTPSSTRACARASGCRCRGHGPRHAGGDVAGHVHRGGRRRRRRARRPDRRRRHRRRHRRGPAPSATGWSPPAGRRAAALTWDAHRRRPRWPPTGSWPGDAAGRRQPAVVRPRRRRRLGGVPRPPARRPAELDPADVELTLFALPALRRRPPRAGRPRYPSWRRPSTAAGRSVRVAVEHTWLPARARERRLHLAPPRRRHHAAGPAGAGRAHHPRPPVPHLPRASSAG